MATRPISNVINVWNQNTTYTGIGLNITDTLSGTNSKLLNLQINSSSKFYVDKSGNVVTTGNVSGNKFTASYARIGGVPTTTQYNFSDGTKPDLYVEKLRAHSASFTYMEAITGSNPIIKLPGTTSLIVGNPSTREIVEYNNPTNGAAITIYPALKPNIGIPNQIYANFRVPDELGIGTNWNMGLVGHQIGSPKNPEYMVDGFGVSNEKGQYLTVGNWKITGTGPLSGGKACIDLALGNVDYSTVIEAFSSVEQMASIPAEVKKYLSGSNKFSTEICVTTCSISADTKFQAGIQSTLLGGEIAKVDIVSNSTKVDFCISGCLVITSDTRVKGLQDSTYRYSTCEDMDNEISFGNTEMKSRRRKILADNTSSLFVITQEAYDLKRDQIELQITSSSDDNDYASAAARLNYTLPLPTYQQVSTDIYNPSYSIFPKDFKSDWETLSTTDSIFVVNAIDIQSGSLVRGIGPTGNQLTINANQITSNVISSSNFNVSGGMLYTEKITGSAGKIESLIFTSITGSSQITASSAGASSGKYAKIKIGNQTFKILLYADS